jgi:ribonuclease HI
LGCYWFSGVVFAGDESDHKRKNGGGSILPRGSGCSAMCRGGPRRGRHKIEQTRTSSTGASDNLLYLCDNQSLLKAVQKWTGDGPKQIMANAPDADVLRQIIEPLTMRVQNGAATFLVKVKAHRGESLKELADSLAEAAREVGMEKKEWCDRTECMVFKWKDKDQERSAV